MKINFFLFFLSIFYCNFSVAQSDIVHEVAYKDKPIIEMTLNGQSVWFLLDTGSAISILDTNAEEEYSFSTFLIDDPKYKVPGFGSSDNQLLHVRKADLRFGGKRLRRRFFAFDLSSVAESIENRTGKKIAGIIGINMMSSYGFVIDMGNNTVAMRFK